MNGGDYGVVKSELEFAWGAFIVEHRRYIFLKFTTFIASRLFTEGFTHSAAETRRNPDIHNTVHGSHDRLKD